MPRSPIKAISGPLATLIFLFTCLFWLGGSSRAAEPHVAELRSIAVLCFGLGLWTLRFDHVRHYREGALLLISIFGLVALHLAPLPHGLWSGMSGRSLLVDLDGAAGLGAPSRPLSMMPTATLNTLMSLTIPMAVFVLVSQLDAHAHKILLWVFVGLIIGAAGLGILQAAGIPVDLYAEPSPTGGAFANRNHQAALLAMAFPVAGALIHLAARGTPSGRILRLFAISLCAIAVPLILVTGSRSGLFLAVAGIAFVPMIVQRGARRSRWGVVASNTLAAGSFLAVLVGMTTYAARDIAVDRLNDPMDDLRWPVWQSVLDALPHVLPWGTGAGTYVEAYQTIEPDALLRPTFSNHAHNEYLEILFTMGVPGALLLAFAFALLIKSAWLSTRPESGSVFGRLGVALIALLALASLTDYPVRTPFFSGLLVLFLIWACAWRGFPDARHQNEVHS